MYCLSNKIINDMTKLEKLYSIIENSREVGVKLRLLRRAILL